MMSQGTLASQLLSLAPAATEASGAVNLANAYAQFASSAEANAVIITPAAIALATSAMTSALFGMSVPNAGANVIQNAVAAFWASIAVGLATSFVGAIAITPPPNTSLAAALSAVFVTNTNSKLPLADATSNIASVFYAQALIGGTVTFPGPTVFPII